MHRKVKMNYMKLVLPLTAALLILAIVIMFITGFGIRYGLMTSVPITSIPESELSGACAQVRVNEIEGTFARKGHEVEEGQEVDIIERYCMVALGEDKYIGVHISGEEDLYAVEKMAAAIEQFGLEEAKAMDYGLLRGSVNPMSDELYALFCSWGDEYVKSALEANEYEDVLLPLMLEVDYYGRFHQSICITLTVIAIVLAVLAIVLFGSSFTGLWDKPVRAEIKKVGKEKLEEEFKAADSFADKLYIGDKHTWCFQKLTTDIFNTADIIWAYARSRRLEGGKLTWYLVMKTGDKREYSVHLGEAAKVKEAEDVLKIKVKPLCTGFDKEKQKLYDKDIATFRSKTKNGTI
ncbi:MAG: hypothetical protein IKT47_07020 [Oscillospiraceae bacterium]|nr:hypothetical protein [Oscillospiraceae bacterium]